MRPQCGTPPTEHRTRRLGSAGNKRLCKSAHVWTGNTKRQAAMARRSALARLSDNPFCAEENLLSSFHQPSPKEGRDSSPEKGAYRAYGAAGHPTGEPQGQPEMVPRGYGYDGQGQDVSSEVRSSRSKTSWVKELGTAADHTPSATPTRPPAALGDAQGWLRVQSVSAARKENGKENETTCPGSTHSAANQAAALHLSQRQEDKAQPSTGSPILEIRRPTSRPLGKNGGFQKQSIETKAASHTTTSSESGGKGPKAAAATPPPPAAPLQAGPDPGTASPKHNHLVEVEDIVRDTDQRLAPSSGREEQAGLPSARPSRFSTAAFQRVLLPDEPPRVDFESVIALLTPTKASPVASQFKLPTPPRFDKVATPKSTEWREQAWANDTEIEVRFAARV